MLGRTSDARALETPGHARVRAYTRTGRAAHTGLQAHPPISENLELCERAFWCQSKPRLPNFSFESSLTSVLGGGAETFLSRRWRTMGCCPTCVRRGECGGAGS